MDLYNETNDGEIIVGGHFYSSSITVGNYNLTNAGGSDGMVIKYGTDGAVEWVKSIGGSNYDYIFSVAETRDGGAYQKADGPASAGASA